MIIESVVAMDGTFIYIMLSYSEAPKAESKHHKLKSTRCTRFDCKGQKKVNFPKQSLSSSLYQDTFIDYLCYLNFGVF